MAEHSFIVVVETEDQGADGGERDPGDYAREALAASGLRDARILDGFADLPWTAYIADIQEL